MPICFRWMDYLHVIFSGYCPEIYWNDCGYDMHVVGP